MLEVTQSQINAWRSCQMKHYYSYVVGIEKKTRVLPLERGTVLHEMLDAYLTGKDVYAVLALYTKKFNKMFAEERVDLGDLPGDLRVLIDGYMARWKDEPLYPIAVEKVVGPLPLTKFTTFKGKVDAVILDPAGKQWLVEHKSHATFPKEDVRLLNLQTLLYAWALEEEGMHIDGILWDYIRTKAPAEPEVLKNGLLSRRANIDTTMEVYLAALERAALDPEDYTAILQKLSQKTDSFYRRVYLPLSRSMVTSLVEDLKKTSLEIYFLQDHPSRTPGRDCGWCSFYPLCTAELRGLDTEHILQYEFKPKEDDRYGDKGSSKVAKQKDPSVRRPDKSDKTGK